MSLQRHYTPGDLVTLSNGKEMICISNSNYIRRTFVGLYTFREVATDRTPAWAIESLKLGEKEIKYDAFNGFEGSMDEMDQMDWDKWVKDNQDNKEKW